jgi:hypothetical protein
VAFFLHLSWLLTARGMPIIRERRAMTDIFFSPDFNRGTNISFFGY